MRNSKFTEHQIVDALKRAEAGEAVKDLCREFGVSAASFYQWRSKYGGLEASRNLSTTLRHCPGAFE